MAESHIIKYLSRLGVKFSKDYKGQEVSLVLNLASSLENAKGKAKILYTMIEGNKYPDEWVSLCKSALAVIVPNRWCQEVLKRAGIEAQIVPLGYDQELFKYKERKAHKPFTFLHYEAFQDRKGWDELLDAWMLSLSNNDDAQLILKTIKPWDEIPERVKQFRNVKVISGELPHEAMAFLLNEADCFIFPSRGEGFSLPPLEAMATGLPVILTKGHSHLDYYNERYMYGIEISKEIPALYPWFNYPIGEWVRADIEDMADKIEYVFDHQDEAFKKGKAASEYVKKYTADKMAEKLKEFIKNVII